MPPSTDSSDLRFEAAEYRVRLFLSVDLSGSTAFKNSSAGKEVADGAAPKWVGVFRKFYNEFPVMLQADFHKNRSQLVGDDECPKLWKAVGDELVFCGLVSNRMSVANAVNSFISTLHNYRKILGQQDVPLNVKGAGWIAAFPEPNRAIQMRRNTNGREMLSASEGLEQAADKNPFDYDFLGKAIDTGFRVAGMAQPDRMVLSVQLGQLLSSYGEGEANFGHSIRMDKPVSLKGVNGGSPYPVLYIDTVKHLKTEGLLRLERSLLAQNGAPDSREMNSYLTEYCRSNNTDEIALRECDTSALVPAPTSYNEHKPKIQAHLEAERDRESQSEDENFEDGTLPQVSSGDTLTTIGTSSNGSET